MTEPGYQTVLDGDTPVVKLADGAGTLRVIAGDFDGHQGPARTFPPMQVWDLRLQQGGNTRLELVDGWNSILVVLDGTVLVNVSEIARGGELVLLDSAGEGVVVKAINEAKMLVLSGEPIDEPIVGHGPFVMNTENEIRQAIRDFSTGREVYPSDLSRPVAAMRCSRPIRRTPELSTKSLGTLPGIVCRPPVPS